MLSGSNGRLYISVDTCNILTGEITGEDWVVGAGAGAGSKGAGAELSRGRKRTRRPHPQP